MEDFSGGRTLIYKSDNIFERRHRILREARKMIAEFGLSNFNVRELCARAEIAQKTLYNAFGSKENVIALAIRQYLADFSEHVEYRFEPTTLGGRLERLIKIHSRNIQIRPYTTAIMAVYNSPTAAPTIRDAIRNVSSPRGGAKVFADHLQVTGALAPDVTPESFTEMVATTTYAVLGDWCLGDLTDDQLVDKMSEMFLMVVVGMTVGSTRTDAEHWLQDLRGQRPSWRAMRQMAEVAPREIQAANRSDAKAARRKRA